MSWRLAQKQSLPLDAKIILAERRIREFYDECEGLIYVAFSGGWDSTVLLHLVRGIYPDTPAVFVDTGLEFPEIRDFVKTVDNVTWLKPKMSFTKVLDRYGFPIISKDQACALARYRTTKDPVQKYRRLNGWPNGKKGMIHKKWQYLTEAPFKISDECCRVMKIEPFRRYVKKTGRQGVNGTMAVESDKRKRQYLKYGCNSFDTVDIASRPLSVWLEKDTDEYIERFNLPYSRIYDTGYDRTGCVFCGLGAHLNSPNKFQIMKNTHPDLHKYCMDKLGMRYVLNYLGVPYE